MQVNLTVAFVVAGAIVLAAVIVSSTLLALNWRTTYPLADRQVALAYSRLLQNGCEAAGFIPATSQSAAVATAVSCPIWVHP